MKTDLKDILDNFEFLDDWDDRYRYVIELGRELDEFSDELKVDANKVTGCVSQVWLIAHRDTADDGSVRLSFSGDSDALIVRGLVRIMLALFNGKTAQEILEVDVESIFARIGLRDHLTPQRSNGLTAMVSRMRQDAQNCGNTAKFSQRLRDCR